MKNGTPVISGDLAALERRMRYNVETTTRFAVCKSELKQAAHFEKHSEPKEAIHFLERLITEARNLQIHLAAWDEYKPASPEVTVPLRTNKRAGLNKPLNVP